MQKSCSNAVVAVVVVVVVVVVVSLESSRFKIRVLKIE